MRLLQPRQHRLGVPASEHEYTRLLERVVSECAQRPEVGSVQSLERRRVVDDKERSILVGKRRDAERFRGRLNLRSVRGPLPQEPLPVKELREAWAPQHPGVDVLALEHGPASLRRPVRHRQPTPTPTPRADQRKESHPGRSNVRLKLYDLEVDALKADDESLRQAEMPIANASRPYVVVRLGELAEPRAERRSGIFATREEGRRLAEQLRQQAEEPGDVILDFDQVAVVTDPFAQELLAEVRELIERSRDVGRIVFAVNVEPDVRESLRFVLERRRQTLAHLRNSTLELLVSDPDLQKTLREAEQLESFTAPEIAARLGIKPDAATHRLTKLLLAGAVVRERDRRASRGIRHLYHALSGEQRAGYRSATRAQGNRGRLAS